ncbi:MAG: phytoene desaturase family protein [Candidatus Binatia bacterium]
MTAIPAQTAGSWDAVVVGSGPNGLAGAIVLAQAGLKTVVFEAQETAGGGARSAALTLPGFVHDLCSAVHPLAVSSPFFSTLPLAKHGLEWIHPSAPLAHPFDDGTAAILERSVKTTGKGLGRDAIAYQKLIAPLLTTWEHLKPMVLGPLRWPRYPITLARFGWLALRSARRLAESRFAGESARALFAGMAAHSMLPLDRVPSAAFGLILAVTGHGVGWPLPRGGAQKITDALISYLRTLGGEVRTGVSVESLEMLPPTRIVLCDVTPRQLLQIAGHRFPLAYRQTLARYRYGVAAHKIDWALSAPIPWSARGCARAGTVHLGGTLEEIASAELAPWQEKTASAPFVLLAQPTMFDVTRAPPGHHTAWAYCHVPNGSTVDMVERIEGQIERFAPGFRTRILARSVFPPRALEQHNANLVGGDINGGVQDLRQLFARPTLRTYRTPTPGLYLCSASTPPGGGVHGMCGYFAAHTALRDREKGKV